MHRSSIQIVLATLILLLGATLCFSQNPYNAKFEALQKAWNVAGTPERAALLRRAYALREYVDDPAAVTRWMSAVAQNTAQDRLLRDEALHYVARMQVHAGRLEQAEQTLRELGFVREWKVAGPFGTSAATQQIPTLSFQKQERQGWGNPKFGPQESLDLSNLYPRAGAAAALAATSVYAEAARAVALRLSADGPAELFVNGRQVEWQRAEAGFGFDRAAAGVRLNAGWNAIALRLQHDGEGPWRFALRITAPEGGGVALRSDAHICPFDSAQGRLHRADVGHPEARCDEVAPMGAPVAVQDLRASQDATDIVNPEVAQAEYYVGRRQVEKARDLLRQAVAEAPTDFVARERLAELYARAGLKSAALAEYRKLEAEFPAPLWLRRELAARYEEMGMLDHALALAQLALAQNFDGRRERDILLSIYERRGEADKLRACYEEMARLEPSDPEPLLRMAQLEAGAGQMQAAEATMRGALKIAPGDAGLHEQFANLLAQAGKQEEAQRELAAALKSEPNSEDLRARLQLQLAMNESPMSARDGRTWGTPGIVDSDAEYLVNAAELAEQAHRAAPREAANAVELAEVRVERVYDNGLSSTRIQQVFYIASEQGAREYASHALQYAAATQELAIVAARAYKTDGRVLEAEDAGESSVADGSAAMYYDARSRTLRFPGLEKGDVVEFDYRLTPESSVNPYGDYFGELVTFRSSLPEELQRYVLITPAARNFNVLEERMPAPAQVRVVNGKRVYRWETRDMPALPNEPRGPALTETAPYVHVSSFANWQDLGRWYAQLIAPQFALDAMLRKALQEIVAGKKTELEKISAIHQFVLRNTHYVALEFGIYGYKPYPVSQVYARRYGDCKDKASLMIALLRAAGIDADIALVRTRRLGDIGERATSISIFNHAIVYVPKYKLWLDGTAEYAGSRELPLDDQGAMALTVARDGSAQLLRIPVTLPMENYTHRSVQAQIEPDGKIEFSGSAYTRGEDAPGLRRDFEVAERQRDSFRNRLAEVLPSVRVDAVQVSGANNVEDDVTVKFRGELDAFAGRRTLSLSPSWMTRAYVQKLAPLMSRTQDLLLPAPWTTEEELHFALPAGARLDLVPQDKTLDTPFGTAALHYQRTGNELVVTTSVQFRRLRITPAEYAGFREFCGQVESAFRAEIKVALR